MTHREELQEEKSLCFLCCLAGLMRRCMLPMFGTDVHNSLKVPHTACTYDWLHCPVLLDQELETVPSYLPEEKNPQTL